MKREKLPKTMHIAVLDDHQRIEIEDKLETALDEMDYSDIELGEYIERGMEGRLCDLEDVIDIYKLETIEII